MAVDDLSLRRFAQLFRGNPRSFGQWDPTKPKDKSSYTEKAAYADDHFRCHLEGQQQCGIGIVPVRDDGSCFWGAIDIDNHDNLDKDVDIRAVEKRVSSKGWPLLPCRSKSGGVHLFIFFSEPVRADKVRGVLQRWAKELEIDGVDCIYPKQGRLTINSEGQQALGNWINLPYYDADSTKRFAVANGKRLSLDAFLSKAEAMALEAAAFDKVFADDLSQMPPCLRARLEAGGFSPGERNTGVYQCAVFCRKRDPEGARDAAHDLVMRFMPSDSIPYKERDKTIKSAAGSRSANYKCQEFKDVCDREACRKLKWGISESEYEALASRSSMPAFTRLVKYVNLDPPRFDLDVDQEGMVTTIKGLDIEDLASFGDLRKVVMARTHVVLPRLKNEEWDGILRGLFKEIALEEAPEDATPRGAVKARLHEFLCKANLKSEGDNAKDREALLRGVPVVGRHNEMRVIFFRSMDFVSYLQKTKTEAIKQADMWFKMADYVGCQPHRLRIGKRVIPVWWLPLESIEENEQHAVEFKTEY